MSSGIAQALDALIKSGNINNPPAYGHAGFNPIDIYPIFEHAFSDKAKQTMSHKTDSLLHQYNEKIEQSYVLVLLGKLGLKTCAMYKDSVAADMWVRKVDLVHFAASRATKEKLPIAISKVIATVNDVADMGFTKAHLVQLSVMEILPIDRPEPEYIVISYISLTEKGANYVKQNLSDMFIPEGGVPKRIE